MSKWKCCKKEPSETGKKVLCNHKGDLFVAVRLKNSYVPMPFADHYFSPSLSQPDCWCEIDFPEGLTGHIRVMPEGLDSDIITLSECEVDYPETFNDFASSLISSMGKIKKPVGMP